MTNLVERKLTKEQQELVAKNEALIYFVMRMYHLSLDSEVDYYGMFAEALCRAAMIYDPNKGYFSTIAIKYMSTALYKFRRHEKCEIDYDSILDSPAVESATNTLIDLIGTLDDDKIAVADLKDLVTRHKDKCSLRDQQVIEMYLLEYKIVEIAKYFNVSKQRIQQILEKFFKKVQLDYSK